MKRTILIVDDNAADVDLIRRLLSAEPSAPALLVAEDGAAALRMLRETCASALPDLILLDLNLPGKSGLQVLAELKEDPALRLIPIVVLSSSNADRDVAGAYRLHANCYFTKPMDIDRFAEALHSIEDFWLSRAILPPHYCG